MTPPPRRGQTDIFPKFLFFSYCKNMRILFFNYEYPPLGGGAGNASHYILQEYAKNPEIQVDFVTSSIDDQQHLLKIGENISIHRLPIGKNQENIHYQSKWDIINYYKIAYKFAKQLVKENQYDLTHSFFSVPCGYISYKLWKKYKIPYIVSLRGADVPGYSERFSFLYKFITPTIKKIWKNAYFVIANSQGLCELALKSNPSKEIEVIYNGIDTNEFYPHPELKDPNEIRIICGTRVTPRKGIRFLIQAIDVLIKRYPQIRLIIVGEGNEKTSLQNMVQGLGLESIVTFLGAVPPESRIEYYAKGDIYVSPSFNEGMANFMLECLALGMPLIATDVGGTREIITEGENGFIIKTGDYNDIVEKLEFLIKNPEARKKMKQASRARAERMSWESVSNDYVELYKKTINLRKINLGR